MTVTIDRADRNASILREHVSGENNPAIGRRHGLTPEAVRLIVAKEARRYIDDLELRLLANTKTGDLEAFLIPDHGGPDFDLAVEWLRWSLHQLAERGVKTRVHYRPTDNGVAFLVEDVTNYTRQEK